MKKLLLSGLLGLITLANASAADSPLLITGEGATFPAPIYKKWFSDYNKVAPNVQISYTADGSGAGKKAIGVDMSVDFGASDGPMTDAEVASAKGGKILHLPTVAGAVVMTYNLEGNPQIKLDGDTIAKIYLGTIKKWNDLAIIDQNPGIKLPDQYIAVIHRADGSGTSFIFTDFLSSVNKDWSDKVGKNTAVNWPVGLGGQGNDGVTAMVKQLPGSIGYVELIYALQNNMKYADIKNSAGKYITASLDSVKEAMATAKIPDDFRFSMVNPPGDKSYPIAGCTWLLVYQNQKDPAKGKALVDFLKWAYKSGMDDATGLKYAALPSALVDRVLKVVDTIK